MSTAIKGGICIVGFVVVISILIAQDKTALHKARTTANMRSIPFVDTDGLCYKQWRGGTHSGMIGVTKEECE